MTEKESLKKLDDTLLKLSQGNGVYKSLAELTLDNSDLAECKQIVEKLIKDGYANSRNEPEENWESFFNVKNYSITFEGKFFRENGGYVDTYLRQKRADYHQTLTLWLTAVGTALAGLYALIEMMKYLFVLCRH